MKLIKLIHQTNLIKIIFFRDAHVNYSILTPASRSSFLVLLRISYLWYTLIGLLIVLIVGSIVSYLTKPQDPRKLDPKLICNVGHHFSWFLPERLQQLLKCSVGETFQVRLTPILINLNIYRRLSSFEFLGKRSCRPRSD